MFLFDGRSDSLAAVADPSEAVAHGGAVRKLAFAPRAPETPHILASCGDDHATIIHEYRVCSS